MEGPDNKEKQIKMFGRQIRLFFLILRKLAAIIEVGILYKKAQRL